MNDYFSNLKPKSSTNKIDFKDLFKEQAFKKPNLQFQQHAPSSQQSNTRPFTLRDDPETVAMLTTNLVVTSTLMTIAGALLGAIISNVLYNPHNSTHDLPLDTNALMNAKAIMTGRKIFNRNGAIIGAVIVGGLYAYNKWKDMQKLLSIRVQ